jgi:hypothetical protein
MLRRCIGVFAAACFLTAFASSVWAQRGQGQGMQWADGRGMCFAMISSIPKQPLDSKEAAELVYLREVEKLARDVYASLYAKWNLPIFGNIAQAEERHFDAIKLLLDRYELADPADNSKIGVFRNRDLQMLYGNLISQGTISLASAARAGAIIEDMDIKDLENAVAATDNEDLRLVFRNLSSASEKHLRAFVRQLQNAGENYNPQYISQTRFSELLAQQSGRGMGARANRQRGFGRGNNGVCPWNKP